MSVALGDSRCESESWWPAKAAPAPASDSKCIAKLWDQYCFVKATLPSLEAKITDLAIVKDGATFCLCTKARIRSSKALLPQNLGAYLTICDNFSAGGCADGEGCTYAHVDPSADDFWIPIRKASGTPVLALDKKARSLYSVRPADCSSDTLGLRVASILREEPKLRLYSRARLFLCENPAVCPLGFACPSLHFSKDKAEPHFVAEYPPLVNPEMTLLGVFRQMSEETPRVRRFCQRLKDDQAIETVRDINCLTEEVFLNLAIDTLVVDSEAEQGEPSDFSDLWPILEEVRYIPMELGLGGAMAKLAPPQHSSLVRATFKMLAEQHGIFTVKHLHALKFKKLLSLPIPAPMKSTLQLIRERVNPGAHSDPFVVMDIESIPEHHYISHVVRELLVFKDSTDSGWRKSWDRPTVSTALTYATNCQCGVFSRNKPPGTETAGEDNGSSGLKGAMQRKSPTLRPRRRSAPDFDSLDDWCTCEKKWVLSVNYELSTPSGSRCSEQNGLGRLASSGLPTSCIRDVIVFGESPEKDPNPLFPCGVCENMFRRLSLECNRKHGHDISLYMFDSKRARKLIKMPFSEISNRASRRFKSFLEEQVIVAEPTA